MNNTITTESYTNSIIKYRTKGTCSREIHLDIRDGIIEKVNFIAGCSGNLQGLSALVTNRKVDEIIPLIRGIRCGERMTSCPDQLARALGEVLTAQ